MQDRCSRSQIGVGERKGGLYFYHGIPVVHVVRVLEKNEFDLWHRMMGHPSDHVNKMILALRDSPSSHI